MTTKQLTPVSELNRALAPTYRHASGGILEWSQEKAFFEAQIKKNWQIAKAVQNKVPATVESLKLAVRECASMGLSMSPNAQLVYFIPRKARKRRDGESKTDYDNVPIIVTATPSYRGLAYIAMNYAGASQVAAEVVYKADHFVYHGPMQMPEHRPTLDNAKRGENFAIGVYAIVRMQDGSVRCEYIDAPTVLKIRQLSEFPNALMWTKLWTEGWRKVPIRRICKTVMITSPRMAAAVEALNTNEGIVFEDEPRRITQDEPAADRGMTKLQTALNHTPEPDDYAEEPEPRDAIGLVNPADSKQPPGTIEWWCDQIREADSLQRLDDIKVAALADMVDQHEDADVFRRVYAERSRAIKEAA